MIGRFDSFTCEGTLRVFQYTSGSGTGFSLCIQLRTNANVDAAYGSTARFIQPLYPYRHDIGMAGRYRSYRVCLVHSTKQAPNRKCRHLHDITQMKYIVNKACKPSVKLSQL